MTLPKPLYCHHRMRGFHVALRVLEQLPNIRNSSQISETTGGNELEDEEESERAMVGELEIGGRMKSQYQEKQNNSQ